MKVNSIWNSASTVPLSDPVYMHVIHDIVLQIAELKKLKKEKDKAVKTVRQYAVNMEDLKDILPRHRTKLENMTTFTRSQMMSSIHTLEEDLSHHKAYLDQLLAVVIEQNPNLLTMIGEAQKMR